MAFEYLFTLVTWRGALAFLLLSVVAKVAVNKFGGGLGDIPGPWLASCSDLWRLFVVWGRRPERTHIELHEKYGKFVRLGPRNVSVADPEALKTIYGLKTVFIKSTFYPIQGAVSNGKQLDSLFTTQDEVFHSKLRRSVSNAYALSTLVKFEPLVDSTTTIFLRELERRFAGGNGSPPAVCDFGAWLQYYAFDVIGELTFSKRLGFVEGGADVDNIIRDLEWMLNYVAVVGQIPELDRVFLKNPVMLWMSRHNIGQRSAPVVAFSKKRMDARRDKPQDAEQQDATAGRDFLSRFQEAREKHPEFMDEPNVIALTVGNMFAGSDTTAITLRAIFYNLLKHPAAMAALTAELTAERRAGRLSGGGTLRDGGDDALVRWDEVRDLPYLGAVIREALRCHPAAGLPLERVVPPQGATICGRRLPGGTVVGCTAWVVHRDEGVFGPRPGEFRPERWLEAGEEQAARMNGVLFSFGAGTRTCIGKHISLLEMYKLVPAVLRRFELSLANPEAEWTLHNAWFVKQTGFKVLLKKREQIL